MYLLIWILVSSCTAVRNVLGANILIAYDLPSPSHQVWNYAFAEGLMKKGHNVTMFGPFPDRAKSSELYHPLTIKGLYEEIHNREEFSFEAGEWSDSTFLSTFVLTQYNWVACNHSYHSEAFRTLMNYPKDYKFDLLILDVATSSCFYPFIQRFNYPPTMAITAFLLRADLSEYFGNVFQPSYVPLLFSNYTEDMSFSQRVVNFLSFQWIILLRRVYEMRNINSLARKAFGEDTAPVESLEKHISLLLCGLDPVLTPPQPLPPNIVAVGGLNARDAAPLPKDLKKIMDNATEGVIFFALGTNARSDHLGAKTIQALLEAFSQLKQTVVWKFESELKNKPKNVFISKWLPQNDILGHKNTKLFISHVGALSSYEAIYHGVPIIGVPFIADQRLNVNALVNKGAAIKLDFKMITSQNVLNSVNEVLTNPKYAKSMKELSSRLRDQPETPLERAVFWTEFVMRHKGAHFLSPKARDMSRLAASSTDVVLFLLSVVSLFLYIVYIVVKKIRNLLVREEKLKVN
uniref:UDP-glycosyltransferase n=1 Tax=Xylotrechus quadripes TaxID=554073 RepID=A0A6G7SFA6_9CUCU|nr:UDP-glycosyltransferase [Xylotrechus quadripes]